MKRAEKFEDIKAVLDPQPLTEDQLADFFVETDDARDPHLSRRLELEERLREGDAKVLLVGHRGCGKSTELVKFQQEHAQEYSFVSLDLQRQTPPGNIRIESLLVLITEAILQRVQQDGGLAIDERTLKAIYGWFNETFEIREEDLQYTGQVGAGADTRDTFWGKLLGLSAFLKADIRAGSRVLGKTVSRETRKLSELAFQVSLLVKEAALAAREQGRELLLIVENLDKAGIADADALFIDNPALLADLPCKAVFTAPIFLLCNPRAAELNSRFIVVTVPMIKLQDANGDRSAEGWKTLKDILQHRLNLSLLEPEAVELVISKTGGVLRHLFLALQYACLAASQAQGRGQREEARITEGDVRYGLNRLKSDLLTHLGVLGLPEEFKHITTEDLYDRLKALLGKAQPVRADLVNLLLLQAHALIEYNGERWHRLHPLVAEHVELLNEE